MSIRGFEEHVGDLAVGATHHQPGANGEGPGSGFSLRSIFFGATHNVSTENSESAPSEQIRVPPKTRRATSASSSNPSSSARRPLPTALNSDRNTRPMITAASANAVVTSPEGGDNESTTYGPTPSHQTPRPALDLTSWGGQWDPRHQNALFADNREIVVPALRGAPPAASTGSFTFGTVLGGRERATVSNEGFNRVHHNDVQVDPANSMGVDALVSTPSLSSMPVGAARARERPQSPGRRVGRGRGREAAFDAVGGVGATGSVTEAIDNQRHVDSVRAPNDVGPQRRVVELNTVNVGAEDSVLESLPSRGQSGSMLRETTHDGASSQVRRLQLALSAEKVVRGDLEASMLELRASVTEDKDKTARLSEHILAVSLKLETSEKQLAARNLELEGAATELADARDQYEAEIKVEEAKVSDMERRLSTLSFQESVLREELTASSNLKDTLQARVEEHERRTSAAEQRAVEAGVVATAAAQEALAAKSALLTNGALSESSLAEYATPEQWEVADREDHTVAIGGVLSESVDDDDDDDSSTVRINANVFDGVVFRRELAALSSAPAIGSLYAVPRELHPFRTRGGTLPNCDVSGGGCHWIDIRDVAALPVPSEGMSGIKAGHDRYVDSPAVEIASGSQRLLQHDLGRMYLQSIARDVQHRMQSSLVEQHHHRILTATTPMVKAVAAV
jgi:hypothetical protein